MDLVRWWFFNIFFIFKFLIVMVLYFWMSFEDFWCKKFFCWLVIVLCNFVSFFLVCLFLYLEYLCCIYFNWFFVCFRCFGLWIIFFLEVIKKFLSFKLIFIVFCFVGVILGGYFLFVLYKIEVKYLFVDVFDKVVDLIFFFSVLCKLIWIFFFLNLGMFR